MYSVHPDPDSQYETRQQRYERIIAYIAQKQQERPHELTAPFKFADIDVNNLDYEPTQ